MSALADCVLTAREWSDILAGATWTWVYFIQEGEDGPIKIGVAKDPADRLRTLQQGNARVLHLRAAHWLPAFQEEILHERFTTSRVRGEWFEPTPEVLAVLALYAQESAADEAAVLALPPAGLVA